jgi:hypothetical protein
MTDMRAYLAVLALLLVLVAPAPAQEEFSGTSYITPFPESDVYRMQVYGDAFAEGLLGGLADAFADDARVQLQRRHRALAGITRLEFADEILTEEASRDTVHIAVVMIGFNDRVNLRISARERLALGSDEWRAEYGRRVDRLIKTLKRRGMAVYWVGQPLMRRPEANEPAQMMNDVVREKAYLNGIKYIDITAHFADETGNYSTYGPDVTGKQRRVREADGILFTWAGYRKLAHFVEREIKRDLTHAKNERAIPLAGSEAEQKRIAAQRPPPDPGKAWTGTVDGAKDGKAAQPKAPAGRNPPPHTLEMPGEQKADNGRISLRVVGAGGREEVVTVELPRPAIPAAVVQLITRKDTGERPSRMGDVLADDVGGGLVVLSSVTPAVTGPEAPRRASPDRAYYRVWVKGERLPPRPGRADDFSWPRVDPEIDVGPTPPRRPIRSNSRKKSPRG